MAKGSAVARSIPGKSGMLTTAIKQLTAPSLWTLREAVGRTSALGYIEPVLRFVLHVPTHKRPVVQTEEDTRSIAMEEEIAKLVTIIIIAQTEQCIGDGQWGYQRGRSAGDGAHMLTMLLAHTREQGSSVVLYKQDRSNAYGTVHLAEVAHLLDTQGWTC